MQTNFPETLRRVPFTLPFLHQQPVPDTKPDFLSRNPDLFVFPQQTDEPMDMTRLGMGYVRTVYPSVWEP